MFSEYICTFYSSILCIVYIRKFHKLSLFKKNRLGVENISTIIYKFLGWNSFLVFDRQAKFFIKVRYNIAWNNSLDNHSDYQWIRFLKLVKIWKITISKAKFWVIKCEQKYPKLSFEYWTKNMTQYVKWGGVSGLKLL